MKEAEQLIGIWHVAYISIPAGIPKAYAVANEDIYEDQNPIRRMKTQNDIGQELASRADGSDATLTKSHVNEII